LRGCHKCCWVAKCVKKLFYEIMMVIFETIFDNIMINFQMTKKVIGTQFGLICHVGLILATVRVINYLFIKILLYINKDTNFHKSIWKFSKCYDVGLRTLVNFRQQNWYIIISAGTIWYNKVFRCCLLELKFVRSLS